MSVKDAASCQSSASSHSSHSHSSNSLAAGGKAECTWKMVKQAKAESSACAPLFGAVTLEEGVPTSIKASRASLQMRLPAQVTLICGKST